MKINIGEILKIGVILFLITAILAALLAFVNDKTAPLIEKNALEKEQASIKAVMPEAVEFQQAVLKDRELSIEEGIVDGQINNGYMALDANGKIIGVCVITETIGYDVGIQTVTGVNTDLEVTGVDIISMNETPGLGAKAAEESFRSQYIGKSGEIGVSKGASNDMEIQAISGATKTSEGVTRGVNIALQAAEILLNGGNE